MNDINTPRKSQKQQSKIPPQYGHINSSFKLGRLMQPGYSFMRYWKVDSQFYCRIHALLRSGLIFLLQYLRCKYPHK
jgi:hypothetical protein